MRDSGFYACICEGAAERVIVNKLLDEEKLIFRRDELLDKEILRCRSGREFEDKYLGKGFSKKITVYRILDSRREEFRLRKVYKNKIDVINVITAPEIELLVIIGEKKYKEFLKYKNTLKPSVFCKTILKIPNVKDTSFVKKYFEDINFLIFVIKEYKRLSEVKKDEKCLADLLIEK